MTYLAPVAPPVPVPSRDPASAILAVAEALQPDLTQGLQIDALRLRLEMERAFGGSDATGAWDWKLAYEAGEAALVLFLQKFGRALLARAASPAALLPILTKVAGLLPTHTRRSEEMERFQQFSTPLPMGFAALAAARITSRDLVLEPSAGTGLIAIMAEIASGSLVLNELTETRADLLRLLFPGRPVTRFDAAQIDDHLDAGLRPSVILMNPPFSVMANVDGRTTEATARHLRSALARLASGGRLVAITGASFAPDAPAWAETFGGLTQSAHLVFTGAVSGAAFAKHGTSFETRISVFDKCRGGEQGGVTADLRQPMSQDAAHLLSRITAEVPPRLELDQAEPAGQVCSSRFPGNFASVTRKASGKSRATLVAQPAQTIAAIEAEDLAYTLRELRENDDTARLSDAIYETFCLQAIDIPGAEPHPTKLVQSAAMASVAPPKPSYRPKMPAAVLRDGLLSDAQLETVIYAGEAHGACLAGSWTVDETGDMVSAAPDDAPDTIRFRRGFFLGDGTGAGKGRQSAGILLDNWCQGRRKALWVSKSDKLLEDAQRDWSALGQERLLVTPLSRFAQGRDIPLSEGILFTTYATLRSEERGAKKSRVDQIVDWLGADFDGVILFDESHAMANAAGSKGERGDTEASQQGRAGLRLQHKLPNARVVYVSATGATTVHNLAYAQRLGLWGGEDFPFATRAEFVEAIEAGGVAAMPGALDQIVQRFGTDLVAEVTGRSRRIVRKGEGPAARLVVESRAGSANLAETAAFMDDQKRILIFSDAGGTGRSYHADLGAKNQRLRVHYLLEPGWKADAAIQGLGRTNRTNQAQPPLFRPVATDVKAEKRFLSTIARRLDTLGAITRGQRQTGGQGLFRPEDNLESPYARDALRQLYRRIYRGDVAGCSLGAFEDATGLSLTDDNGLKDDLPPITTFLNRLLALTIDMQAVLFSAFEELLDQRIEGAIAAGVYDLGLETLRAESFRVTDARVFYTHPGSGAETQLLTIAEKRRNTPTSLADALDWLDDPKARLLVNSRSGRAAVQVPATSLMLDDGTIEPRLRLIRPTEASTVPAKIMDDTHWLEADRAAFTAAWTAELAEVPEFSEATLHIVAGLLLPIWKQLPHEETRVYRLQTDDGQRIIGRRVSPAWVATTLADDAPKLTAAQVHALVLEGKTVVRLAKGMELHRSRVIGVNRIELSGFIEAQKDRLKADGFFSEIISWKLRLFCPTDSGGIAVLDRLLARCSVTGLHVRKGC